VIGAAVMIAKIAMGEIEDTKSWRVKSLSASLDASR
jgi:hypothetical protein